MRTLTRKPLCPDCNIILVSLDTLSANHLPCYGYRRDTAPHLCAFGKENIMFDNAYANAHFTLPSHVSMFTGLLPSSHNVNETGKDRLSPTIPLLPEILQKNGYNTYFNIPHNSYNLSTKLIYNRGVDGTIDESIGTLNSWQTALDTLRRNKASKKKTFLFLHSYYVHSPYLVTGEQQYSNKTFPNIPNNASTYDRCDVRFLNASKTILKENIEKNNWYDETPKFKHLYDKLMTATNEALLCGEAENKDMFDELRSDYYYNKANISTQEMANYLRDLYDQRIGELDDDISVLLKYLDEGNNRQNTIIIITADHGEEFMEHHEILHTTLYDSNVKIPLFVYAPGVAGKRVTTNAQTIDITPTILDLVGIYGDYAFQGESLVKDMVRNTDRKRYVAAERIYDGLKTIRDDTYKLFVKKTDKGLVPFELYNTKSDPGEQNNILYTNPGTVKALQEQLEKIVSF